MFPRLIGIVMAAVLVVALMACGPDGDTDESVRLATPTPAVDVAATVATSPEPEHTHSPSSSVAPQGPAWPLTIAAVGDVMPGRSVAQFVTEDDPGGPFEFIREWILEADFGVANFESAIAYGGVAEPKYYTFLAPPLAARGMAETGFHAVSVANNHGLDFGVDALLEGLEHFREAGVAAVGAGADADEAHAAAYIVRNGVRVAVLGFNDVNVEPGRGNWEAGPGKPGIAWWEFGPSTAAISAAAERADIVIVMVHFGIEYSFEPSARQVEIAYAAINAGADVVLGHHPHVLQRIEEYNGGLIAYSLGNFVFDGFDGESNNTGVLFITFDESGIADWALRPAWIGGDGRPRPSE